MSFLGFCIIFFTLWQYVFEGKAVTGGVFLAASFFQKNSRLYQVSAGQCLRVVDPLSPKGFVAMAICDGSSSQQWHLEG